MAAATDRVKQILSWYSSDSVGVKTNLSRLLNHGTLAGTGKLVILPVDQGFEHGPARSFAPNPAWEAARRWAPIPTRRGGDPGREGGRQPRRRGWSKAVTASCKRVLPLQGAKARLFSYTATRCDKRNRPQRPSGRGRIGTTERQHRRCQRGRPDLW